MTSEINLPESINQAISNARKHIEKLVPEKYRDDLLVAKDKYTLDDTDWLNGTYYAIIACIIIGILGLVFTFNFFPFINEFKNPILFEPFNSVFACYIKTIFKIFIVIIIFVPYIFIVRHLKLYLEDVVLKNTSLLLRRFAGILHLYGEQDKLKEMGLDRYKDDSIEVKDLEEIHQNINSAAAEYTGTKTTALYNFHKGNEENYVGAFTDSSRRHLLWVVRYGIIGTFIGLFGSFIIYGVDLGTIPVENKDAIKAALVQAMFGYASAVLSSIIANWISVYYEKRISNVIMKINLLEWIEGIYIDAMQRSSVSATKDSYNALLKKYNDAIGRTDLMSEKISEISEFFIKFTNAAMGGITGVAKGLTPEKKEK
ncbi:MAG: hypothetical protein P9X24_13155 [Candidatus Hatepunaea meridiana]|nr:hypothetical protein [Candidatus Hatepunaea meridiana]